MIHTNQPKEIDMTTNARLNALRTHLADRGMEHLLGAGLLAAYRDGTCETFLATRGALHLVDTGLPALLMRADAETPVEQCRQWAAWFREAGYEISFQYTDQPEPFDRQWQVWTAGGHGKRLATIDIDGCGASWHGPDELWRTVVGPHVLV